MNPERPKSGLKGVAHPRTKGTIKRLQMYRNFKAKRDRTGKILTPAPFQVSSNGGLQEPSELVTRITFSPLYDKAYIKISTEM